MVHNSRQQPAVSADDLPQFLARAKSAAEAGRLQEAADLVTDEVVEAIHKMGLASPSWVLSTYVLATVYHKLGRLQEAKKCCRDVIEVAPFVFVYYESGTIYREEGFPSAAIEYLKKAAELDPDRVEVWHSLAEALIDAGRTQQGVDLLRKVVEKTPGNERLHSDLLFNLHYLPRFDPQTLFEEHKRWAGIYAPADKAKKSHSNAPDPDRKLRVGYLSADFGKHLLTYSFEPLLETHDKNAFEIYGYSNSKEPGKITEELKAKFDYFRDIHNVDDEAAVEMIENDRIDILMELSGHTGGHRLTMMACKPAPVQVSYLGYFNTTAVEAVDYFLTDSLIAPPELQRFFTEEFMYLPHGVICYRPYERAPDVTPLPALKNGYVTFGVFCNNRRINHFAISLWAEVLKANENSRLLMKFRAGDDSGVRDLYHRQFEQLGIDRERVEICRAKGIADILQHHGTVDISLDTYPINGGTGAFNSMWMGVPAVSLTGTHYVSRVGLSIRSRVGLESFAVSSPDDYVAKATELASDLNALAEMRSTMRQRLAASSLCDTNLFTRNLEEAYRKMWHRWCRQQ